LAVQIIQDHPSIIPCMHLAYMPALTLLPSYRPASGGDLRLVLFLRLVSRAQGASGNPAIPPFREA
jgi:hypothetical protein